MPPVTITGRHILKNGSIPAMTLLALTVGDLLAGAVVVETVFNMTGVGMITQQSVRDQDTPVVMAVVVLVSTIYVLVNLVTDLLYPRDRPRHLDHLGRRTRRWAARAGGADSRSWPASSPGRWRRHDRRRSRTRSWRRTGPPRCSKPPRPRVPAEPAVRRLARDRLDPAARRGGGGAGAAGPRRPAPAGQGQDPRALPRERTGSAPTTSAATCGRGSSTAPCAPSSARPSRS